MFRSSRFSCTPRTVRLVVAAMACLGISCAFAMVALGQEATPEAQQPYRQIPVDAKVLRELRFEVSPMLVSGFKPGDEAKFDEYYQKAVFPAWTNPDDWAEPRNPRQVLLGNFRQAKRGPVYDRLNNLAMRQMIEFVNGRYHPVVRYNAMLMIGELNESESTDTGQPAKPLASALRELLPAYEKAETPDGIRLAALIGIVRHYRHGSPDAETRRKIHDLLISLAAMRDAPDGRSKEGHAWFRRLAIETLGRVGSPGEQGIVVKTVVSVLAERDTPLSVRIEAARALGQLKLTAETMGETDVAVKSLGQLAADACQAEIALCEKNQERIVNARKVKGELIPIRIALTGSEKKVDRPPYKGILGLMGESSDNQTALAILREVERLLDRKILDRDELAPQVDNPKKKDADPGAILGMGPEGFDPGPLGPDGMPAAVDPTKAASGEVLEELKKAVVEFRRILAGG
ncbi:MAG: hypothetical protein GX621_08050 [Pirellulaceae bacterium]|nr:hypothetical protein [Pirellulaceae bacterium]